MSNFSPHRVEIGGFPGQYTVTIQPQGITQSVKGFAQALRRGETIARKRNAPLDNKTAHRPMRGDMGPKGLIGSPSVFVIEDSVETIVCVLKAPWARGSAEKIFIGPKAIELAHIYAAKLFAAFKTMALEEQRRRERRNGLRRAGQHALTDQHSNQSARVARWEVAR